ncbi:MAG: hypothetical protein JO050_01575 [Acidimicrobiia bacterium]|nr:hypothetical protein [Acidimicrobiia bacterium]
MDPIHRRNAGLRRIVRITKAAVAGGLVLTGGLSALAARSFSGTSTAAAQSTATQSTAQSTQSTTKTTTPALQSPSYSIGSSSGSGRVTSGGS